ncbi:MAG: F0F1 ATP synthase subunit A [Alphaproteobacteria bacterium]|nr:F0F1 ATP synthase subunit A [Alphaproteobacteria bacterium]
MAAEHSPLEQFAITRLVELEVGGIDVSFTNSSAMMLTVICLITLFLSLSMRRHAMVPGRWQLMAELSYEFIAKTVRDTIGTEGKRFFPFVFTLFMFILFSNGLGLIPHSFTVTSHIIVTFALAAFIFLGVTLLGFVRHGFKFLTFFLPPGVPIFLAPLLVPIELISYLSRPVSLSVRLAANMLAGHTMLAVFAGFVVALGVFGVAPFIFIVLLYGLETLVAFLQAYVFAVLTCIYISDAIHLHH